MSWQFLLLLRNIKFTWKYPPKYLYICNNKDKICLLDILMLCYSSMVFWRSPPKYKVNYFKLHLSLCHMSGRVNVFKIYLPVYLDKCRELSSIRNSGNLEIGFVSSQSWVLWGGDQGHQFWIIWQKLEFPAVLDGFVHQKQFTKCFTLFLVFSIFTLPKDNTI